MTYFYIKEQVQMSRINLEQKDKKYSFSGNKNNEERRLINKSDFLKFDDTLIFDGKSTVTTYNIGYKTSKILTEQNQNGEELHTGLNIKFDEDTNLDFKYSDDKRYTTKTRSEKKVNDLSTRQYSVKFETKNMIQIQQY